MSVGYLPCSFDLINVRDLDLIGQAVAKCSRLVVGVLPDEDVVRLSGRPPVVPLVERMTLVSHIRGVDDVVVHDISSISEMERDLVVFRVADDPDPVGFDDAVVLTPARQTSSAALRHALRAAGAEAIAS